MGNVVPGSPILFKRIAAIHRRITTSLNFEEALGLIAASGLELFGAATCLVLLRGEDEVLRICAAQGVEPATADRFSGSMEESVLGDLRQYLGFSTSQNISASPIMSAQIVQGILVVIRDAPLNAEENWLLSALADQAAITLGNAHLHESLISRGVKLQEEVDRSRKLALEIEAVFHSVAADLRAPLQDMTGGGQLVEAGARRIEALLQELVAYTQLATTELHLEPVDLDGAVAEALAELRTEIDRRGGQVRVRSPLARVLAHRKTLVKILGILLSNAAKFVGPGEAPRVEVNTELVGESVRISVLDNGTGISQAHLNRMLGVSGRSTPAEDHPGTTIGLAILQRGIDRMRGRCGVESKLGKGNCFWIELRGT